MIETFRFGRLDRSVKDEIGYSYPNGDVGNAVKIDISQLQMTEAGLHWSFTIKNHLRTDVLLVSSLRTEPQRISSIYSPSRSSFMATDNFIIIELRQREMQYTKGSNVECRSQKTVTIRCPGHMLEKGALFVEELGFYLTVDSRIDATRELIAHEIRSAETVEVSIPGAMMEENPKVLFQDFETFLENCIERSDKIIVSVGHNVKGDPARVPDYVKSLRIAVGDRDFSPYLSGRMQYDPSLGPDDFVIKNLLFTTNRSLPYTFSQLYHNAGKVLVVDHEEHNTLRGRLYGLAIFADTRSFTEYIHTHRSEELYNELSNRLIEKSGNPVLKKQLEETTRTVRRQEEKIKELEDTIKVERESNKTYKRTIALQDETINRLESGESRVSQFDRIMMEQENARQRLENENEQLRLQNEELQFKRKAAGPAHKASVLKTIADMAKSVWGIMAIAATAILAAYKGYNKLKSSSA